MAHSESGNTKNTAGVPSKSPKRLWRMLTLFLQVAVIIFLSVYLYNQFLRIQNTQGTLAINFNPALLVVAQLLIALGSSLFPLTSYYILSCLGYRQSKINTWKMYSLSGIAKYLPGSVWALPGRVFLYDRADIPLPQGIAALAWEILLMVVSAVVVGLLGWRLITPYVPIGVLVLALVVGLGFMFFVAQSGAAQGFIANLPLLRRFRAIIEPNDNWLNLRQIISILLLFFLSWLVLGIGFSVLAYSIEPDVQLFNILELTGIFAFTWVIGFLAFFAPGGIGVREGIMIVTLITLFPEPTPTLLAIISRIMWTIAECSILILILLYQRIASHKQTKPEISGQQHPL